MRERKSELCININWVGGGGREEGRERERERERVIEREKE